MVQAYQVSDANKVHSHEALLQCSLWYPSRPTPGVINSRERLRAAVIGGRTARGVVGTPTPGNGGQGRAHAQKRFILSCMFVAYKITLIGTVADAYRPGNCAAAR